MARLPTPLPRNVLVLCHGNICRSPLAQTILLQHTGWTTDQVCSAGLGATEGKRSPLKIRLWASQHGYNVEDHRATPVTNDLLRWAELVLYMDGGNARRLQPLLLNEFGKSRCLAEWGGETRIPDPNFVAKGEPTDRILRLLHRCCLALAAELRGEQP